MTTTTTSSSNKVTGESHTLLHQNNNNNKDVTAKNSKRPSLHSVLSNSSESSGGVSKSSSKSKRVKTGCLTCRKKHRKCDELKKTHANGTFKCNYCYVNDLNCSWPDFVNINLVSPSNAHHNIIIEDPVKKENHQQSPAVNNSKPLHVSKNNQSSGLSAFSINPQSPTDLPKLPPPATNPSPLLEKQSFSEISLSRFFGKNSQSRFNLPKLEFQESENNNNNIHTQHSNSNHLPMLNFKTRSDIESHISFVPLPIDMSQLPNYNSQSANDSNIRNSSYLPSMNNNNNNNKNSNNGTNNNKPNNVNNSKNSHSNNNEKNNTSILPTHPLDYSSILEPIEQFSVFDYSLLDNTEDDYLDFPMTLREFMYVNALNANSNSNLASMAETAPREDYSSMINGQNTSDNQAAPVQYSHHSNDMFTIPSSTSPFFGKDNKFPFDLPPNDVLNKYFGNVLKLSTSDANEKFTIQPELEHVLIKNYVEVVGSGLDIFDDNKIFSQVTPIMMRDSLALKYAILAFGSRYIETTADATDYPKTLTMQLYEESLRHLIPCYEGNKIAHRSQGQTQTYDELMILTCVTLTVFEMMSSDPKVWKSNIEGSAILLKTHNINGFSDNVFARTAFWVFARMFICCSIINESEAVLPIEYWLHPSARGKSDDEIEAMFSQDGMQAHYIVYLNALVINLIYGETEGEHQFKKRWIEIWKLLKRWTYIIPDTYKPIHEYEDAKVHFPRIFLSNSRAISANQMFHMACIIMLSNKPRTLKIDELAKIKTETLSAQHMLSNSNNNDTASISSDSSSTFNGNGKGDSVSSHSPVTLSQNIDEIKIHSTSLPFHAKRIIGIAISSNDYAAGTNSIQPLYLAGKIMSSTNEHGVCLGALRGVERYTGWSTKSRCRDLIEYWTDKG